ncbi:hypothetical protein BDR26DRAFT_934107 [Obelidium mucronatum]|nr:hypothetical protein BDR26DRAFT_934107 [Obelidium mucronatum]
MPPITPKRNNGSGHCTKLRCSMSRAVNAAAVAHEQLYDENTAISKKARVEDSPVMEMELDEDNGTYNDDVSLASAAATIMFKTKLLLAPVADCNPPCYDLKARTLSSQRLDCQDVTLPTLMESVQWSTSPTCNYCAYNISDESKSSVTENHPEAATTSGIHTEQVPVQAVNSLPAENSGWIDVEDVPKNSCSEQRESTSKSLMKSATSNLESANQRSRNLANTVSKLRSELLYLKSILGPTQRRHLQTIHELIKSDGHTLTRTAMVY